MIRYFIYLFLFIIMSCQETGQKELSALGAARVSPLNHASFSARYCAPEAVAQSAKSLLIFIIDNSGSNNLRTISENRYIGTDTVLNLPPNSAHSQIARGIANQRYQALKEVIEAQTTNHSYALITFSDSAYVQTVDANKILTKAQIINKIEELLGSSPYTSNTSLSEGGTNYIEALDTLSAHTTENPGLIEEFLQNQNLGENDFAYTSVYFFSDGAPIVDDVEQPYPTIYQKLNNFMFKNSYLIGESDIPVYKSFNTIFYSFPYVEMEWDGEEEKWKLKIVNGDIVINTQHNASNDELKNKLRNMATTWGRGSFYDLAEERNFETIGIGNRVEKFRTYDPFVLNLNAKWHFDEIQDLALYKKDTDGDGLTDDEEIQKDCNPLNTDSNDNGLRDGIEGDCNTSPDWFCSSELRVDNDGDGLTLCEEKFLMGLDSPSEQYTEGGPDQNNNQIPDFIEVHSGLSLVTDQSGLDFDGDGLTNLEEILLNTPLNYSNHKFRRSLNPHQVVVDKLLPLTSDCSQVSINNFRIAPGETNPEVKIWYRSESFLTGLTQYSSLHLQKWLSDTITPDDFSPTGSAP